MSSTRSDDVTQSVCQFLFLQHSLQLPSSFLLVYSMATTPLALRSVSCNVSHWQLGWSRVIWLQDNCFVDSTGYSNEIIFKVNNKCIFTNLIQMSRIKVHWSEWKWHTLFNISGRKLKIISHDCLIYYIIFRIK